MTLRFALPLVLPLVIACEKPQTFTTTMEVLQVETFKDEKGATATIGLSLRYADCPGDARRILRGDKKYAACAGPLKAGDKIKADFSANVFVIATPAAGAHNTLQTYNWDVDTCQSGSVPINTNIYIRVEDNGDSTVEDTSGAIASKGALTMASASE